MHDPIQSIVLQANPMNVDNVMIAGKFLKRDVKHLYPNLEQLLDELQVSGGLSHSIHALHTLYKIVKLCLYC
jgi:hypothetical protein